MGIDLVTLAQYKAYVGITSTTQDAAVAAIIPRVSALVKSICRRTFVDYIDDPKTQIFNGGYSLPLAETPVLVVQSVEFSSDYGSTYTSLVEFTDYALDLENESIVPVLTSEFTRYTNGYRVTYTAGYETFPEDLKLAVMDLITYYLRNDSAIHSSKAVGANTVQIEYVTNTSLPAHIRRVLDLYSANYN